jgi:HSP20 family protein
MVSVIRREPYSLFDELFSDFFNRAGYPVTAGRSAEASNVTRARMDVLDKGEKYEVVVDLPGVKKDDIQITVEGPRVAIVAETKAQSEESKNGQQVLHRERYSRYARSFELPAEVTEDGADAQFENGVLTLVLPKRAAVMSKRLTVR